MYKNFEDFTNKHKKGETDQKKSHSPIHKATDLVKGLFTNLISGTS